MLIANVLYRSNASSPFGGVSMAMFKAQREQPIYQTRRVKGWLRQRDGEMSQTRKARLDGKLEVASKTKQEDREQPT